MKVLNKKNKGITLVALVITIIILLILAGITISQLSGSGLFENAKLAEQKSKDAEEKEEGVLGDYENKIGKYIDSNRDTITQEQYSDLLDKIEALEQSQEYQVGDTITFNDSIVISGYISNGGKDLFFSLPLGKNISKNVKKIEFSTKTFNIRAEGKWLINGAFSENSNFADHATAHLRGNNQIAFFHTNDTAHPVTNNTSLNIALSGLTITFK